MEKSSEKVIPFEKPTINPFNNLLSEVQLKINQPKSSKKIENYVLHIDSNIDKSNSNLNYHPKDQKKHSAFEAQSKKNHNNVYVINAPLRTKHSSDTLSHQKKERQIITQWITGFMSKRHILGTHWEHNFEEKKNELVSLAFNKIKYYKQKNIGEDQFETNLFNLVEILQFLQNEKKKQAFSILKEYYKDDQLFGLSNTIKENNSLMLKIESEYQSLSVSSPKFKKQAKRQQFASNSSSSYNNVTKKRISQSGDASEDLSALILNHNQLKLSEQLNRSNPNIPKSKNSQKNIKTHKQITQLSLQTRKLINSQRKLSEEHKQGDLPLQSNKQLKKTKKDLIDQSNQNTMVQNQDKNPITMTFVMNNLNLTNLINNHESQTKAQQKIIQISKKSIEQSIINKNKENTIKQAGFDQNIINKLPFAQSFYQPVSPKNELITFIRPQNPKRSTSLQIKYNNPILFEKNEQVNDNNISNKNIFNQQYYPEQNNRENQHFISSHFQVPIQKVRPKSATPKITFTFSNSNITSTSNLHKNQVPSTISDRRVLNQQYQHPQYDQQDCVLQSIINAQPLQVPRQVQIERKNNKIQIVSPSRRPQSPKRTKIPQVTKIALNHRQHIKNIILPPFNDYYENQKTLKPNSNLKLMMKDNQLVYLDNFQKSTAQNSLFSPRQSNSNRVKSPKDKIFVTYTSNRNY